MKSINSKGRFLTKAIMTKRTCSRLLILPPKSQNRLCNQQLSKRCLLAIQVKLLVFLNNKDIKNQIYSIKSHSTTTITADSSTKWSLAGTDSFPTTIASQIYQWHLEIPVPLSLYIVEFYFPREISYFHWVVDRFRIQLLLFSFFLSFTWLRLKENC